MDKPAHRKRLATVALVGVGFALAVLAPNPARAAAEHGVGGGHPSAVEGHHGFDGHRDFDRGRHDHSFLGDPYYGYYYPPAYGDEAPTYWYYCPSYADYYPNVTSCPEAWVTVPTS